jgi:hypothetical protein
MGLALDVGLASLALGIERVELEVEIMLGRLAGVDARSAEPSVRWASSSHRGAGRGDTATTQSSNGGTASMAPRWLILDDVRTIAAST